MVALFVILYCGLLALNIWFFLIRPSQPWSEKVSMLLQVVGAYTFAFGVLTQTGILKQFSFIADDMTSPDLFRFIGGNMRALAIASSAGSVALEPAKTFLGPIQFLEPFFLLILFLFGFVYMVFHVLVILPWSYLAYVLVSIPVMAITTSARDVVLSFDGATISVREVVSSNTVALKNIMVALSAMALALTLRFLKLLQSAPRGRWAQLISNWFAAHRRVANLLLVSRQVLIGTLLLVAATMGLMVPLSSATAPADRAEMTGEIIGVEIVLALLTWTLVALFLKTRKRRDLSIKPGPGQK